jgi:hypothetical protein
MRHFARWVTIGTAGLLAFCAHAAEEDQLRSDLIGQTIGGREKCWKFQSVEQIRELVIQNKNEDSQKRVYTLSLRLQATKSSKPYEAEVRVEYTNSPAGWKMKQAGLLKIGASK